MTHVATRAWFSAPAWIRMLVQGFGLPEAAVALLLASALWAPSVAGAKAWPLALAALLALAAVSALRSRRVPPVPIVLLLYLGVYGVAALHGGSLTPSEGARYFVRPVIALGVAALVNTPMQRLRVLGLVVLFVATQVPISAWQAFDNVLTYGREATIGADSVTGTLGPSQAGVMTLVAMAAAVLVVGGWLGELIAARWAAAAALPLLAVGVLSSTRAEIPFVVLVAAWTVVCALSFGRDRPALRRLAALLAASLVVAPAVYGATRALYPQAFVGLISSQQTSVLGGAAAQGIPTPLPTPTARSGPGRKNAGRPAPRGVELLPGRFAQLRLALDLSAEGGVVTALLGRGPGAAELDPVYTRAQDVPRPQRTGSTWVGVLLTETGWLGLMAFAGLLVWLSLLGRWLWRRAAPRSPDRALGAALPGLAALTALGAVFATILDVRGYSIVFWVLVGVAISAAADVIARRQAIEDVSPAP